MVTIRDVAKQAGVSISTVSNVINNRGYVADETAQRVKEAIKELNYVPDYISRGAKCSMVKHIGVVVEDIIWPYLHSAKIIQGVSQYCDEKSYQLQMVNMNIGNVPHEDFDALDLDDTFHTKHDRAIQSLLKSNIRGIIYVGMHPRNVEKWIKKINVPVVTAYSFADHHPSVLADDFHGGKLATEYLIKNGHSKIGILSGPTNSYPAHQRFLAYQEALMEHNIPFNPSYMYLGNWQYQDGVECCRKLMALPDPPTAIFAMNDMMAYGILNTAHELNIRIPEDLSVIGYDNLTLSYCSYPALTTVELPFQEMGRRAAGLLIRILEEGSENIQETSHLVKGELYPRNTVAKI